MGCMTPLHADTISVPVLVTLSFSFPVSLCLSLSFCHSFCLACLFSFFFFLSSVCLRMSVCRVLCLLCFPVLSLSLFFYLSNLFITLSLSSSVPVFLLVLFTIVEKFHVRYVFEHAMCNHS